MAHLTKSLIQSRPAHDGRGHSKAYPDGRRGRAARRGGYNPPDGSAPSFQEKAHTNKADHEAAVSVGADADSEDVSSDGGDERADVVIHKRGGDGVPCEAWQEDFPDDRIHGMQKSIFAEDPAQTDRMDRPELDVQRLPAGSDEAICDTDGYRPFYCYYQIGGADESDEAEDEPKKEGELRTEYEGSHSLFGFVWQIASATGWSVRYILDGVNYQALIMMLSDAPRYVRRKVKGTDGSSSAVSAEDEANEIAGYFRSKLNT